MSGRAANRRAESAQKFRDYSLYGILLRSEIPLTCPHQQVSLPADVTISFAPPDWFTSVKAGIPERSAAAWYEHQRCADGSDFLHFPHLFQFVVSPDGRTVSCGELERSTVDSFHTYLLGHVLSFALVKQGVEPLHATTVVIDGGAVALLGDSGYGKSTLAAAFVDAGYRILTDDLLVIREDGGSLCGFPGPPRIKLFPAVAQRFFPEQACVTPMNPATSKLIIPLQPGQLHLAPAPLKAFVVLDQGETEDPIRMSRFSGAESIVHLLAATFNTRVATRDRLRRQFVAAGEWAARIPVRHLEYRRVLDEIGEVRDCIVSDVRSMAIAT